MLSVGEKEISLEGGGVGGTLGVGGEGGTVGAVEDRVEDL